MVPFRMCENPLFFESLQRGKRAKRFIPSRFPFIPLPKKKQVLRKVGETVKLEVFVEGDSSLPLRPATATDRPHVEHQWPTASPGIENPSTSPRRFLLDLR